MDGMDNSTNVTEKNPLSFNFTFEGIDPLLVETQRKLKIISMVLYLVTFVVGVVGNTITVIVISRTSRIRTVASCLILNLAIADDLFVLTLPFYAVTTWIENWIFGQAICTFASVFYNVNRYASIFTMVIMSIDRYLAIAHPLKSIQYRTVKNAGIVCMFLWMLCMIIILPFWMYTVARNEPGGHTHCRIEWPRETIHQYIIHDQFWVYFCIVIGFIIPCIIMIVSYILLLRQLTYKKDEVNLQTRKPIKKVTKMVFIVTVVFIVCWTPITVFNYISARIRADALINPRDIQQYSAHALTLLKVFSLCGQALVYISSCCNPFIYAISSQNFRK